MNAPAPRSHARTGAIAAGALLFVALVALLYYGVRHSADGDREALPSPLIGKPAPAFDLPLLHEPGKRLKLADLHGKPFVLNVWGSWCAECRVEHPVIARFAYTRRVRFVGYNLKDEREDAIRWLERYDNPYSDVVADVDGRTAIEWGIYGAPETFLVDADGIVRWKHVGAVTDAVIDDELIPRLEKLESR
ncbi:DsbE family thiol:disulfide interchange protein [Pseudoxanthomonas sangjuensis]|uniref:DsbE family thiol:disulfide interchange protein n=1 Tax=Pseudoxanthomonas sangjuensis TaxID=1503750 RepID=UPI001391C6D8|nr:DsbE family thiol:disulfide interchange protein [Pseudoxanthomonas sangjuensis]KAF1713325.1 DsbE family thiol:disulfide interchange protein [Pseudoxanthomonas sangjuensis]